MTILILNHDQFGYKAGYYHYSKHLTAMGHKVVFLCRDKGLPRMQMPEVDVYYAEARGGVKWRLEFIRKIRELKCLYRFDVALCPHFKGCSLIRLALGSIPTVADVRSGYVIGNKIKRKVYDALLKIEVRCFNSIMVLGDPLAKKLGLKNYGNVSLGAEAISDANRNFNEMKLLYVGTLDNRNISKTIDGVYKFLVRNQQVTLTYDIIGFGSEEEERKVYQTIIERGLSSQVKFHGRVNYDNLKPYFDKATIGVAFVPMTEYYDCQPATKIYEYALSGIYSIATNTTSNKELINVNNGMLCDDNSDSFAEVLNKYYLCDKTAFDVGKIKETMREYEWRRVVSQQLVPILETASKK